jgi:hypothetical protein
MALSNFASARWNVCSRLSGCPKTNLLLASSSENGTPGQNVSPSSSVVYPGQAEHLGVPGRRRRQRPVARRGELRRAPRAVRGAEQVAEGAVVGAGRAEVDVAALLEGVSVDELVGAQAADEDEPLVARGVVAGEGEGEVAEGACAQGRQRGLVAQAVGVDDPGRLDVERAPGEQAGRQRPGRGPPHDSEAHVGHDSQKLTLTRAEKRRTGAWLRKSLCT